ncbi:MAG TPA: NUDIX hydrolase [Candidatus Acidoferrales bacterium]|nr:NUDIX hydrolase [Candidatus Acidoferrales bacterium]
MKPRTKLPGRVLSSRVVWRGRVFDVRRDRVREPGGVVAWREIVLHYGSVVLVPVLDDGRILLVRQYRHATGRFLWELVAGRIERGERPGQAARRELEEETGYHGSRFRRLIGFFPTPGFVSERMTAYAVGGLRPGRARPEADERIEVRAFGWPELERWIRAGRIQDGKSLAALLYYGRFLARR